MRIFKEVDMKKEYSRILWDEWPEDVTDMEAGAHGKRKNNNHFDITVDDIDERIITLDTSKFESR